MTDVANKTELSPHHRAAVVLLSLGVDAASKIFGNLSRPDARKLTQAMAEVRSVPPAVRRRILAEFSRTVRSTRGGGTPVVSILEKSLGKQSAADLLDEIDVPPGRADAPPPPTAPGRSPAWPRFFAKLTGMEPAKIAGVLSKERPQTCAAVLSHMDAKVAGRAIMSLPEGLSVDVAARMARIQSISPRVVRVIEADLEKSEDKTGGERPDIFFRKIDGARSLASALVTMPATARSLLIETLSEEDPQLAEQVNEGMFVFDDLARTDDLVIQQILREVAIEDVAPALKDAADGVRDAVMRNLSERARQRVLEEIEFMGRKTGEEVRAAQRRVVAAARRLNDEGKISLWEQHSED